MDEQAVLELINNFIVANGNNEITANVLRPILISMVEQPNNVIGSLSQLNTVTQENIVAAINELYNSIQGITDTGIKLYEGTNNPNDVPPPSYYIADFYIQKDLSNNPIDLWQYNGLAWIKQGSGSGTGFEYAADINYVASQTFTIDSSIKIVLVCLNNIPLSLTQYTRFGNQLVINPVLSTGDIINVRGMSN